MKFETPAIHAGSPPRPRLIGSSISAINLDG